MVIFFSGTGNSRYVAESIGALVNDKVVDSAMYIKEKAGGEFWSEKPYVFVCPTYGWQIPRVFARFIESGTFKGSSAVYFILTCGTDIGGAAAAHEAFCNGKGFRYKGSAQVIMPENYVAMFAVPDDKECSRIIAAADEALLGIADCIAAEKKLPAMKTGVAGKIKSKVINPLFYSVCVSAKGFRVDENKCTACGNCMENCPLNNIYIKNYRPYWGEKCTHCMACISTCPVSAIDYKKRTAGKKRYFNDKVPPVKKGEETD